MDILSDAIAAMRTGRPHSSRTLLRAPWSRGFQPVEAAGFHIVLSGNCWVLPADSAPILLGAGDVLFLPRGAGHVLSDGPVRGADAPPLSLTELLRDKPSGTAWAGASVGLSETARAGALLEPPSGAAPSGAVTELLCGAYRMDRSRSHPLLDEFPEIVHLPARPGRDPALRATVELLCAELEHSPAGADATVPALLDVLLVLILRTWLHSHTDRPPTGWAAALGDPAIAAALRCIHEAPALPWTVQSLASRAGLSRAAFARRFAALTGRPPLTYLTWWRLTTAARLLRGSDAPLSAVAAQVGYGSEYAFANAFKRRYGMAPGRYRRSLPDPAGELSAPFHERGSHSFRHSASINSMTAGLAMGRAQNGFPAHV